MLLTTEDAKRRILDHLQVQAETWDGHDLRPFSYDGIRDAVDSDSEAVVKKALEELQEEDNTTKMSLQFQAHLPNNSHGKRVARNLVLQGHRMGSWAAGMFWSLVLLYAFFSVFPASTIPEAIEGVTSPLAAYNEGVRAGIVSAVFFGMILATIIHSAWSSYRRSSLMHEEFHQQIARITKAAMVPAAILVIIYFGVVQYYDLAFDFAIAAMLFLAGFPIGWGYGKLVNDQRMQSSEPRN